MITIATRNLLLDLDFKKPEVLLDIQYILRVNSYDLETIHYIYKFSCFNDRIDILKYLDSSFKIYHSYDNNIFFRWSVEANREQTILYLSQFDDIDFSASDNEAIINLYFGNRYLYSKFYLDERVQLKSYLLGQPIHKKEIIDNLKKTKPYMFI